MGTNEPRPFLASQRRDVLASIADDYIRGTHAAVVEKVGAAIDPAYPKLDGKGGSLDGTLSHPGEIGGIASTPGFAPICLAYPGPPPSPPPPPDPGPPPPSPPPSPPPPSPPPSPPPPPKGKDAKDSKEGKEGKEDKDSSDSFKAGASEVANPLVRYGHEEELPAAAFNAIAQTHGERVNLAIARGSIL